jgi:putative transposase
MTAPAFLLLKVWMLMGKNGYPKLGLKDREWTCSICKTHHIRDWNASINILEKKKGIWNNKTA